MSVEELLKIKEKVEALKSELQQLETDYYSGNATVHDEIYDSKLRKLIDLETNYPEFKTEDSPTQNVGKIHNNNFAIKIKHEIPMLSLSNAFNEEDLIRFFTSNEKVKENLEYYIEPKIDGASISLVYENNILKHAITRGDGVFGEDLTEKIKKLNIVPEIIENGPGDFLLRGEIFITFSDFEKIQEECKKNEDKNIFANHRNYVSGTLRLKNLSDLNNKKLQAIFYFLKIKNKEKQINKQLKIIQYLKVLKIPTHSKESTFVSKNHDDLKKFLEKFKEFKNSWDVPSDGAVIKINNIEYYEEIGSTSKFPKWAIAFKYPSTVAKTKLLDISTTVGRSGRITYVGHLEPVEINGSIVKNATLHNWDYIKKLDLRRGDVVEIYKSGEIIPKVIGHVITPGREKLECFEMQTKCPSCNSELIIKNNKIQFCKESECYSKIISHLTHFVSRDAMNIEGLSEKIIEKFYKLKLINNSSSIYSLKNKKEKIISANLNIKEKLFKKLISSIEKSKETEQQKVLFSLGIEHLGEKAADLLINKFGNIESIFSATKEEILKIDGLGEVLVDEIENWWNNEKNKELVIDLKNIGIIKSEKVFKNSEYKETYIKGKSIVITGTFNIPRNDLISRIEKMYGGVIKNSVTKKIDFLFLGENPGSKLAKAESLNIKIINAGQIIKDFFS